MRLTIIVPDKAVYKDGVFHNELSWVGTPEGTHALQWFGANGWVEYNDGTPNQNITTLPAWANNALASWEEANAPKPEPEPAKPSVVSMRQARLALLQVGLLSQVDAAVAAGGEADKITWEYATEVQRGDSLVQNLASGLGLTDKDLDNLFLLASTL